MDIIAAVLADSQGSHALTRLRLDEPRPDEIVVELAGTGVCHTDLTFRDGKWPFAMPCVLGHEGAGTVIAIGRAVTDFAEGDHVVLTSASCGRCPACRSARPNECVCGPALNMMGARADGSPTLHDGDTIVHGNFVGQSSFATHALASARSAVKVSQDLPLALLGTLGCGVQTGAGAVLNVLKPPPRSTVAVFGLGAVGLAAIAAAKAAGCASVIGVDVNPMRFELARTFGATDVFDARASDASARLRELTGGGVDGAIEASGSPQALRTAFDSTHESGTTVLVGVAPLGTEYTFDSMSIVLGRVLTGSLMGRSNPPVFIPQLVEMYRAGLLPLEAMTRTYPLAEIDQAMADAAGGGVVKPVLLPGDSTS